MSKRLRIYIKHWNRFHSRPDEQFHESTALGGRKHSQHVKGTNLSQRAYVVLKAVKRQDKQGAELRQRG
jgi:hypothetical protein